MATISLPESLAWDAVASIAGTKLLKQNAAAVDNTDWFSIVSVDDTPAAAAARFYITNVTSAASTARRGLTLADFVAAAGPVVQSTEPHPLKVGPAKTDSIVDYRTMVHAAAAAATFVDAAAAAKVAPVNSRFKDPAVMNHIANARWSIVAAGMWHYDKGLMPAIMTVAATAAVDIAFVCGLVQQGSTAATPRGAATETALYGAVALLAALTAASQPGAAPALHKWATTAAASLRVDAAVNLRDPRPPARDMKATDAQILLESHSATLSAKAASRLRLAVALNGYISANEAPATISAVAALPTLQTLTSHILEKASVALKTRWKPSATERDDITPFAAFLAVRT
jgi:hypothetical protein